MHMCKGANRYQKVVGQNGVGKGISGLLPRMYFWKVIFALIFGAGRKSGSAYALVDLVTLAPLSILIKLDISKKAAFLMSSVVCIVWNYSISFEKNAFAKKKLGT